MEKLQSICKRLRISVAYAATLLILSLLLIQDSHTFYCTDSFCELHTLPYAFPCPEPRNCTQIGYRTFLDPDVCNCCEYCFDYLKENDTCSITHHQKPAEMCGPHLKCVAAEGNSANATCQTIVSGPGDKDEPTYCMRVKADYDKAFEEGNVGVAQMNPDCDAGGWYAPRQCLPGSLCYCSDQYGNRIFGISHPNVYQDCACARDIARVKEMGFTGKYPHCLPNGDYDELQCVVRTCFCKSHPEQLYAMHELDKMPCYNSTIHVFEPTTPRYYIKNCELALATIEVDLADAEEEGTTRIVADKPKCDPDGSYAPVQSNQNRFYCADPDSAQIESFEADKFSLAAKQMNCYCARAKLLLANSATGKPRCCSNGNYKPWQCIGSRCFCVDRLGRQNHKIKQVHEDDIKTLDCYASKNDRLDGNDPECDYEYQY